MKITAENIRIWLAAAVETDDKAAASAARAALRGDKAARARVEAMIREAVSGSGRARNAPVRVPTVRPGSPEHVERKDALIVVGIMRASDDERERAMVRLRARASDGSEVARRALAFVLMRQINAHENPSAGRFFIDGKPIDEVTP